MNWVYNTYQKNKRSINKFKAIKSEDFIFYHDLTMDMRFIFRQYFDFRNRDVKDKKVLISNKSNDGVNYAECDGYILYDLDKVAFNNVLLEMKQENRKYKRILNKKDGDEF